MLDARTVSMTWLLPLVFVGSSLRADDLPGPRSPEDSLRAIRVRPGFRVELVVQEPLVRDPIAFDWSADGRLWVVEMGDYPEGLDGKGKPGGVVRVLGDSDGDGRYDRSTVFLDGLGFPTGIMAWRRGVLIACAPDVFYAEDTDGDGRADRREVILTGFPRGNPQHLLNGFEMGLDGWVYGANGAGRGEPRSVKTGQVVQLQNSDFRFRPDDGRFEGESGKSQFGRRRDDWGNWFANSNTVWGWHYVVSAEDVRRSPTPALTSPRQVLDPDRRVDPASRTLDRFNDFDNVNRLTSANSPTPYRDDLFGPGFASSLFVSEPVHNLIRRLVLEPAGPTVLGHRAADESKSEFLASEDNWFRPTSLRSGPDGALWVADMYRLVIEHPEWIPDDWEATHDLRAGADLGRIYRVFPDDHPPRPIDRLDRLETDGLVAALDSPNGWRRDTAQRLLLHESDREAAGPLRRLIGGSDRPEARVQALWTLAGIGALGPDDLVKALDDVHPEVRRNAIRIGRDLLADHPALGPAIARRADDPDDRVRFAVALVLGSWDDPKAGATLIRIARRSPRDSWMRAAVLGSASRHPVSTLLALSTEGPGLPASYLEPLLSLAASAEDRDRLVPSLQGMLRPDASGAFADGQVAAAIGLLDGLAAAKARWEELSGLIARLGDDARVRLEDEATPDRRRLLAIRFLGRPDKDLGDNVDALAKLLNPRVAPALQLAAVAALGRTGSAKIPDALLAGWRGQGPALRGAILDTLLARDAWAAALLSSLEDTCVPPAEVDPARRARLLKHRDPSIRDRADAVFARAGEGREAVLARYRPALTSLGDREAGAKVFEKACASCHRLGSVGFEVGPDLAALTDRSPEALLVAILDPNRAVEGKYGGFAVELADGRVLDGLIADETSAGVTLRRQGGQDEVVARNQVVQIAASGRSLMPEGLEEQFSPADLADLIAFLGSTGPPPKVVAGNRPETTGPGLDGAIALRAEAAEIRGDSLTFDPKHNNLGLWVAPNDRAAWNFDSEKPGRYEVRLDWACADPSAGNPYLIILGDARIEGHVEPTGSWDDYRSAKVGTVELAPGRHRLEVRPVVKVRGTLINLRAVELRPVADSAGAGS